MTQLEMCASNRMWFTWVVFITCGLTSIIGTETTGKPARCYGAVYTCIGCRPIPGAPACMHSGSLITYVMPI